MIMKIRCGWVLDLVTGEGKKDKDITVKDGKIDEISNVEGVVGQGDVDLSELYILPGFVDAHNHLCFNVGDEIQQIGEHLGYLLKREKADGTPPAFSLLPPVLPGLYFAMSPFSLRNSRATVLASCPPMSTLALSARIASSLSSPSIFDSSSSSSGYFSKVSCRTRFTA